MYQPPLDPELAHLAEFDVGFGDDGIDLATIRSSIEALLEPPPARAGIIADRFEIGADPPLQLHAFAPTTDRPHPCLLWLHGGGYVMGSPLIDSARMQRWAVELDCVTVSVDYRLAPEHPFPAAHEDARAALAWVLDTANVLGVDPTRVVVGGASAGGGLAAALALAARDLGQTLAGQLLFYPMLDDRQCTESSGWDTTVWSPSNNAFGWRAYLGPLVGGAVPPYAAPARAEDLTGSARALLIVGGADGFVDEDVAYATALTHAGVPTDLRVVAGAPHGFDLMAPDAEASRGVLELATSWLASTFRAGAPQRP